MRKEVFRETDFLQGTIFKYVKIVRTRILLRKGWTMKKVFLIYFAVILVASWSFEADLERIENE